MYYSNQYNDPTGSVEVDRALGKSYDVVKAVYNQLGFIETYAESYTELEKYDATLKLLNNELASYSAENTTGVFIGHDQGRVGVEPDRLTFTGENFLSALTRSWDNLHLVADNITAVTDLANHLNNVKALSYIIKEITNLSDNCSSIKTVEQNIDKLKELLLYVPNVLILYSHLDALLDIADKIKDVDELQDNIQIISNVNNYLHTISSLNNNLPIYDKANLNLKTYLEILEFRFEITNLSNNITIIQKANELVEKQTVLVETVESLAESKTELLEVHASLNSITVVQQNLDLISAVAANADIYNELYASISDIHKIISEKETLLATVDSIHQKIEDSNTNIAGVTEVINQATAYIDTFQRNLPSVAILTGKDNRTVTLLDSFSKPEGAETFIREWSAPANGWFVIYFYGEAPLVPYTSTNPVTGSIDVDANLEPKMQETITVNNVPLTLKVKKPCSSWDESIQIYVVKDTVFNFTANNLKSIYGKVQFVKEGTN